MSTLPLHTDRFDKLLTSDGFIAEPAAWSEAVAVLLAQRAGIAELSRDHWRIIRALREHYRHFGTSPPAFRHLCSKYRLGQHCVERLFHGEREAWRIAGLPDPGEEVKTYMQ